MRSTWSEPYLWVHLAGIAAVPIFLELCLLGLKAAESALPAVVVFLLVAAIGIGPIFWMQWQRPFSIFSLVFLALKPSELTETQRRILRRFKTPVGKVIAVSVAIAALIILWQLNQWVPLVVIKTKIVPGGSLGGLGLAAIAFLLSNLFLQVPASVLPVLLTSDSKLAATDPYPIIDISKNFTLIGLRVKQILPQIVSSPDAQAVAAPAEAPTSSIASPEPVEPVAAIPDGLNLSEVEPTPTEEIEIEALLAEELVDENTPEELESEELKSEELHLEVESEVGPKNSSSPAGLSPESLSPESSLPKTLSPETQPEALQQPHPSEILPSETLQPEIVEPEEPSAAEPAEVSFVETVEADATNSESSEASIATDPSPNVTDTIVAIQLPTSASEAEPPQAEPPAVDETVDESTHKRSVTDTVVKIEPPDQSS